MVYRGLLKVKHNPEQLFDVTIQPAGQEPGLQTGHQGRISRIERRWRAGVTEELGVAGKVVVPYELVLVLLLLDDVDYRDLRKSYTGHA